MTPGPSRDILANLPLRPLELEVLLALLAGDRHGYGLMKAVEHQSNGVVRLEVGSLYRVLSRMLTRGWIEPSPVPAGTKHKSTGGHEEQRRYYRITPLGRRVAVEEIARLRSTVRTASALLR